MSIIFIRALILYVVVVFSVRLMGKRQLGELQPSELVITILVSNIATLPLEDINIPILLGLTPILALVCFEVVVSWISLKFPKFRKIISGRPKIIISDGKIDAKVLRDLRFSVDDLMMALRGNNIFKIEEVQFAIVETTGNISVMKKANYESLNRKDFGINQESIDPPQIIVSDGVLMNKAMNKVNFDLKRIKSILNKKNLSLEDVFLMTADISGNYFIAEKKNNKIHTDGKEQ